MSNYDTEFLPKRVRHVKRGTEYDVLGVATLQNSYHLDLEEGDELVVYQGDDGKLHARLKQEFWDGRFAMVPSKTWPTLHEKLEKATAAVRDADECGAVLSSGERVMCDDPRVKDASPPVECFCRKFAQAALESIVNDGGRP